MDNKPVEPLEAQPTVAPVPQVAATQATPQPPAPNNGGSKKKFIIIGVVVVLVIALAAAAYWFRQTQSGSKIAADTVKAVEEISKEAESLKVEDIEKDFTEMDADLETL